MTHDVSRLGFPPSPGLHKSALEGSLAHISRYQASLREANISQYEYTDAEKREGFLVCRVNVIAAGLFRVELEVSCNSIHSSKICPKVSLQTC